MDMVEIDGSVGGGQVLRTALGLSAALGVPFHISDIRKNRSAPGLKRQHMAAVSVVQAMCDAEVSGNEIGSTSLSFSPMKLHGGQFSLDVGTAGSVNLVLQAGFLACVFLKDAAVFRITGGTDAEFAPPADYVSSVVVPALSPYLDVVYSVLLRGYFPTGEGSVEVRVVSTGNAPPIEFVDRGPLLQVRGVSHGSLSLESSHVVERQAQHAEMLLKKLGVPVLLHTEYSSSSCAGSGLSLFGYFGDEEKMMHEHVVMGSSSLGKKGKHSSVVAKEAVDGLLSFLDSSAVIDTHLGDNLIPYLGLFGGEIRVGSFTDHMRSNICVTELFLGKRFFVDEDVGIIRVEMPYLLS